MNKRDYQQLVARRYEAWGVAERKSHESGHPFQDREGIPRNNAPRDLVGLALREWCIANDLEYK